MSTSGRSWPLCFAGISGAIAVIIAAAFAHGPVEGISADDSARIETAVRYQLWHALALLGTAVLMRFAATGVLSFAAIAFATGIILFCGGLYLLGLTGIGLIGWLVPLGGMAFVAGWLALALQGWRTGNAARGSGD